MNKTLKFGLVWTTLVAVAVGGGIIATEPTSKTVRTVCVPCADGGSFTLEQRGKEQLPDDLVLALHPECAPTACR